jgi:hypothetical protein
MFRVVFWDILPCKMIVDRRFRGAYCLHHQGWFCLLGCPRRQLWTVLQVFTEVKKQQKTGICNNCIVNMKVTRRWRPSELYAACIIRAMKAVCTSETSVNSETVQHYFPERFHLYAHHHENLKSHMKTTESWTTFSLSQSFTCTKEVRGSPSGGRVVHTAHCSVNNAVHLEFMLADCSCEHCAGTLQNWKKKSCSTTRHEGAWGERMYSSYSFSTLALDGSEWSLCPSRTLAPGKGLLMPIVQEAGWASELVWTQRLEEKASAPAGDWISITRSSSP